MNIGGWLAATYLISRSMYDTRELLCKEKTDYTDIVRARKRNQRNKNQKRMRRVK